MYASKPVARIHSPRMSRLLRDGRSLIILLIPLLVLSGLSFSRAAATAQPASQTAKQRSLPNLRGQEAIGELKQQGLYSSLQQAMTATRYQAEWQARTSAAGLDGSLDGAYELKNEAHKLRASIAASEMRVASLGDDRQPSWQLGMKLIGYGFGDSLSSIAPGEITAKENRVEIRKSAIHNPQSAIVEWYINSERGIEQGFDIAVAPAGKPKGEALRFSLELSGSLEATLDETQQSITLSSCNTSLVYSGLEAFDARGRSLSGHMELAAGRVTLVVDDTDAEYPLRIDPLLAQQVKLTASDGAASDFFGVSVAISGDTVVVGAPNADVGANQNQGSAYVFVRSGSAWSQQSKLTASDGGANDHFGVSVAISGDTVVVGAWGDNANQGSAYVYVRGGSAWSQQLRLTASDGAAGDFFGYSVAITGDTVVVGAYGDDVGANPNQGSAYVFVRGGTTWSQQQKLTASDGEQLDDFGRSVAISGDTVVVGASFDNSIQGSAYIYVRSGIVWSQQQKLIASDGAALDFFGDSVAISDDTVVVGAYGDNTNQGSVYVYIRSGIVWSQYQKLVTSDGAADDQFGSSVAISGDTVIVGAHGQNTNQGSAYVYVKRGTVWSRQQKLTASDGAPDDQFGSSVAFSGDTVVVGANGYNANQGSAYVFACGRTEQTQVFADDGAANDQFGVSVAISGDTVVVGAWGDNANQGSAYVYVRSGIVWSQQQKLTASDGASSDFFGVSVAISGDTVIVGAYGDNANQGSAYVYVRSGSVWSQQQKLSASDGAASDLFGVSVAIGGDTVVVGARVDDVGSTDQGSAYVFVRSGTTWSQQQKLTASDGAADDQFGVSVAISGDTVVVGAWADDVGFADQGSAYVYVRSGGVWSEQQQLTASDGAPSDFFGVSLAISSDTIVVGAFFDDVGSVDQGSAYVFVRSGTIWSQQQMLAASDGAAGDRFGVSVAINGDTIVAAAYVDDVGSPPLVDQGSVYVFVRLGTLWSQQQQLIAYDGGANDNFGISVGLSGDTVVVGADFHDALGNPDPQVDQGSAYVFFGGCNSAPTATPSGAIARQQGSPASVSALATVSDIQDPAGSLIVTATSVPPGITVTGLTNTSGNVTASVAASCSAALGTQTITLQAQDSNGATSTANVAVNVTANTTPNLGVYPATTVPTAGSTTITPNALPVDNGSMSFAISIPGYLGGYTFNPVTGVLSISSAFPQGVYPVTIAATDNCGFITATAFPLTVGAVITVNPATLPNGSVGVGYNQTLTATGGASPYTFATTSGTLPPGLTLSSGGVVSGTPTNGGNFSFTVQATDNSAAHDTGSRAYSLVISGPTAIKLISCNATSYDDGISISWQTGHEVNNLGFNIHRDDGGDLFRVNSQLIAGSALTVGQGVELGSGYTYNWWDGKNAGPTTRYWLEDVDLGGHSTWHGPFVVTPSSDKHRPASVEQVRLLSSLGATERASTAVEPRATLTRVASPGKLLMPPVASGSAIKIVINQTGWYRVTQPELINAGLDPAVDPFRLQLSVDGRELAISVRGETDGRFEPGDAIEFYATAIDSPYSNSRVYWLIAGNQPGKRIASLRSGAHPAQGGSFALTVERRDRSIYFAALRNGERENFFGSVVYTQPLEQALTVQHLDTQTALGAGLEVALQGVTNSSHEVTVQLNGSTLGALTYQGLANQAAYFRIPSSLVREGRNTVTLSTTGDPSDVSLVNYLRLTYQHTFAADDDRLMFTAEEQQEVTITGFIGKAIRVFDVTDSANPQELVGEIVEQEGSYAVAVRVAGAGERLLLALTDESAERAAKVTADWPSSLRRSANAADLLIVTHRDFIEQARLLAELRRREGLSAMVVDIEDIYDEFSHGQKTPYAVKDFLLFSRTNWKAAPRYLVLFGDASYDAKNYLGLGELDLLPTRLVDTVFMESASDDWFADFDDDLIADIAVGRLPARTKAEAELLIKKLLGYGEGVSSQETLLAADVNDGYDFEGAIDTLRGLVPSSMRVVEVKRGQMGDAAAKAALIAGLDRGQKIAAYSGHGSVNSWRGNLLTNVDAGALTNGDRLTVFVMMNCLNGYFNDPQTESMAEALLKSRQGGAIAVWASSAMTFPEGQSLMNQELYRLLFGNSNIRLGDAVVRAKLTTGDAEVRRTWILFGDPTMRVK